MLLDTAKPLSRWRASGIHLLISLGIAVAVGSLIYFVWYPPQYFEVAGGNTLMLLIMGVDVVMGPMLTLAIFKAGKHGLRFDLIVIALLQTLAFAYGLHVIAIARPAFVVAEVDRFVLVAANELDDNDLGDAIQPEFASRPWTGPRIVGARVPEKGREGFEITMSGLAGKDVDKLPKYYVPYDQVAEKILARAHPLAALLDKERSQATIVQRFVDRSAKDIADLAYVPLKGRLQSYAIVLSRRTKLPLTALPVDPW